MYELSSFFEKMNQFLSGKYDLFLSVISEGRRSVRDKDPTTDPEAEPVRTEVVTSRNQENTAAMTVQEDNIDQERPTPPQEEMTGIMEMEKEDEDGADED